MLLTEVIGANGALGRHSALAISARYATPRGLPRKPSSFSRLINNFVSPDEPTSVTGGDTLFGSGIAALKRPHVIEDRSDYDLNLRRHD